MFFDFERSVARSSTKGVSGSKSTRSAGAPGGSRPASRPSSRAGFSASARQSAGSVRWPRVVELHRGRQQRLEPDGAARGLLEGQALLLLVLRGVERADDVDQPLGQRLDHRHPVVLGAQRRRELEEGAVVADVELVQRQVVDRGPGGDREPGRAGAARAPAGCGAVEIWSAW